LGHSYGGVLGYELACKKPELVQSLILSNAPTNIKESNDEYDRLYKMNPLTFWNKHACRVGTPPALQDAMAHAGSVWVGMDVVLDYVAQPSINAEKLPPTLVISGSNDFAYKTSNEGAWRELLPDCAVVNFDHGAHYPFYESGAVYGRRVEEFLTKYEGDASEGDASESDNFDE
jgi:pimeloyl-ACP methyl ester carboxylesterase